MRFISLQENLKKGLNIVGHITTKNINLPILNNILVKTDSGNIKLISTNLEIGIVYELRGKIESEGELTVDSKLITEYVSLLSEGEKVVLESKDSELLVQCKNYKTKIKTESSQEFPLIPVISQKNYYSCSPEELKKALNSVIFSVSTSENRAELTGVLFNFKDKKLSLAATDSYRLAEKQVVVDSFNITEDQTAIVPAKTIQELLRVLGNFDEKFLDKKLEIKIYLTENQILFVVDSVNLISRLISGHYPDYKQIIPSKSKTECIIKRLELVRAIKAAALFSRAGINDVNLKFIKKKLIISSFSRASGESQIEIEVENTGEDNEISINYRYLIDGLNNINEDKIKINILNNNTPCLIKPEKSEDYLYIVMPIKE
jgi:DNA polymerase-3 subunit beta